MVSGKYSALAGAISREQSLANISNNLANVTTTGYKKMIMSFESMLQGENQIQDARGINYSRVSKSITDFSSGPMKETGNEMDLAIHGSGFFKVLGPEGPLYTRSGAFTVDQEGTLKTSDGYSVLDDGNIPVQIPPGGNARISINALGVISTLDTQGNREEVGRLGIVSFEDPNTLTRRDNTTFIAGQGSVEQLVDEPQVVSGHLELGNVNMIEEMANMIQGQRLYETYHKVLKGYSAVGEKQEDLGTLS
ncbi:MAG: flagellar basal-body rod protein FlgF [Desulfobulbaceae bacterium]|nr:MAG: flagellar basal-body rod protein FlgF [Desulfobulbaceae bacterium]